MIAADDARKQLEIYDLRAMRSLEQRIDAQIDRACAFDRWPVHVEQPEEGVDPRVLVQICDRYEKAGWTIWIQHFGNRSPPRLLIESPRLGVPRMKREYFQSKPGDDWLDLAAARHRGAPGPGDRPAVDPTVDPTEPIQPGADLA